MPADDLHVAAVRHLVERQDREAGRSTPKGPLRPVRQGPLLSDDGGRLFRAGTELLYFNLPAPLHAAAGRRGISVGNEVSAEGPRESERLGRSDRALLLGPAACWWPWARWTRSRCSTAASAGVRCTTDEGGGKPRDRKLYQGPFGNARWSQDIYFKLLECGLRIPPSAGSGSGMAPNPVGYNRVYVHLDGDFSYEAWWKNFRAGRVVVTNGPLMRPSVEGQPPGPSSAASRAKNSNSKSA